MQYLRMARKFLQGKKADVADNTFSRQRKAFESANLLVRVYYGVTFFLLVSRLNMWSDWLALKAIFPLWPVVWVELVGIPTAVHAIMIVSLVTALLSSLFPEKRVFRSLLFIALLEYVAFNNSFGKINHDWHSWLGIGFFFIFLPDGKREQLESSITHRQLYLTAFWAAQALVLGFYSLSGFWKVVVGVDQLLKGEVHAFAPEAFAYEIADRLLQTNSTSMIGPFIIEHPKLGWPMYLGAIYWQLFAFVAAFRPSLHRLWGLALICFHVGSYFTLSIGFPQNVLLLTLFLVGSPLARPKNSWGAMLYDLPLIGWVAERGLEIFRGTEKAMPQARL